MQKISKFCCVDLEKFMLKCGERYQVKSNGHKRSSESLALLLFLSLLNYYYFENLHFHIISKNEV